MNQYQMKRERSPDSNASNDEQYHCSRRLVPARPQSAMNPTNLIRSNTRVFVANIHFGVSWKELFTLFMNEVGGVTLVHMYMDAQDKPRGCASIEFSSPEIVRIAVCKMHNYELHGRNLVVREEHIPVGVKDATGDKQRKPVMRRADCAAGGDGGAVQWGDTYGLSIEFLEGLGIQPPLVNRVCIVNMHYNVDRRLVKQVFKMAGRVLDAEILLDHEGSSRGVATVLYEHPVEAVQAISMFNGHALYDRPMNVRLDRTKRTRDLPDGLGSVGPGLGANGQPWRDIANSYSNPANAMSVNNGASLTAAAVSAIASVVNPHLGISNHGLAAGLVELSNQLLPTFNSGANYMVDNRMVDNRMVDNRMVDNRSAANFMPNPMRNGGGDAMMGGPVGNMAMANGGANGRMSNGAECHPANVNRSVGATAMPDGNARKVARTASGGLKAQVQGQTSDGRGSESPQIAGNNSHAGSSGYAARGAQQSASAARDDITSQSDDDEEDGSAVPFVASTPHGDELETPNDTIIVKNIPIGTTSEKLKVLFVPVGNIVYAEMKAKDVGIVRFANEWDGNRAVRMMDRKKFGGRLLEVALFGQ